MLSPKHFRDYSHKKLTKEKGEQMPGTIVENAIPGQDNSAQTAGAPSGAPEAAGAVAGAGQAWGWKEKLGADLKGSPLLQKFEDTPEGLGKAFSSHANLEQLLGHEKVPIPKDVNDVEGWNRFSKAMGIPDKAEGYGLPDANIPKDMAEKGLTLDKNQFAEVMHAHKVHPSAVKGIWETYQKMNVEAYGKAMEAHKQQLIKTVNQLKSEWGDAYQVNVEMGQTVINKFSADQETNDYLTTVLSQDPRAIKFLAKIGEQFAENKVGEFAMKRFSLSPDEALEETQKMSKDLDGPYMNAKGKFTDREHQAAVDRYNMLIGTYQRARQA
jgi:hypothetical protein